MKFNEYIKLISYVLITFVVVWILALISNKYFDVEINSDTAIISFIGIIATFIVVGNYSQVAEMRNQALEQSNKYNAKIDEFNLKIVAFDKKLAEIEEIKEKLQHKEQHIERLQTEFNESQFDNNMFLGMQYIVNNAENIAFYLFMRSFDIMTKQSTTLNILKL